MKKALVAILLCGIFALSNAGSCANNVCSDLVLQNVYMRGDGKVSISLVNRSSPYSVVSTVILDPNVVGTFRFDAMFSLAQNAASKNLTIWLSYTVSNGQNLVQELSIYNPLL